MSDDVAIQGEERRPTNGHAADLAEIRRTTTESLKLLQSLVDLLLPRQEAGDGPELSELVRAMVAQQREIFIGVKEIQANLDALIERSGRGIIRANGRFNGVGRA